MSRSANHTCFITMTLFCMLAADGQAQSPENVDVGKAAPSPVVTVGSGVTPPRIKYQSSPEYSEEARSASYEGTCLLRLIVGPDGNPRDIKVARTLGMGLDEKAIDAVRTWTFEPARKDGKPVAVLINIEVNFRLYRNGKIPELQKKADAGDPKAELELARAFFDGRDVAKNEAQGLQLLESAANRGLAEAQFQMGEHAYAQDSRSADYVNAYMWYELARRSGYKRSGKMLKKVTSKMSPEQLSDAKTRVDNWPNAPAK
jgi:TonB family protein